jgi:hypothetical protein
MIRQLAQCPYCHACEIALTDSLDVTINPEGAAGQPCPHLICVEGRYSEWGLSALIGRKTKLARIIGSNEFEWQHPNLAAGDDAQQMRLYLKELAGSGMGWEYAPAEQHVVRTISLDHKVKEPDGREYPSWEVEGVAVFAARPAEFLGSLPASLQRRNAEWTDLSGSPPG